MKKSKFLTIAVLFFVTVFSVNAQNKSKMKYAIISQGFPVNPSTPWFPNLKIELNKLGIETLLPKMSEVPSLEQWQNILSKKADKNLDKTVLIGHSIGCVNILKYIESSSISKKIPLVILVAPPAFSLGYEPLYSFFEKPLDYDKINSKVDKIIIIVAKNDSVLKPEPLKHISVFMEKLNCKIILLPKGGHFAPFDENGSNSIPELVEEIKLMVLK
jgi:uncharacterized protein